MKKRPATSKSSNKISKNNNKNDLYLKDSQHVEKKIIEKYLQKGFESLSVEELATTLVSPTFESEFKRVSGTQWPKENKSKAKERLNFSKFNIEWSVYMNSKSPSVMLKTPFGVLFTLVERADVQKVTEYFRKNAQYMNEIIHLVDNNKKSLLHVVAKVGNVNMISLLLSKKFDVYARDKFFRTPLHLACQFGREVCADELLKAGSQILARDSIGRTCLHYAACSDSVNLVVLILGKEPDLVTARDTYGRTALHYSVWNGTSEQVNIVKKLLESKAEVDALDEEGMTSLHFAAEAGKGKIIPILLKFGANPFIKDGRTGRTAIELACNDRIREMIIVYASKDYEPQLSLLKLYGKNFVPGQGIENGGEDINGGGFRRSRSKGKKNKNGKNGMEEENDEMDVKIGNLLQNTYRKKLLELLRAIQLYGVKTMQHMTKPELYSGSWLERINNANDFYNYINDLSPSEAILSIYNVLYPYSDKLPKPQGEEPDLAFFFDLNSKNRDILSNGNRRNMMMMGSNMMYGPGANSNDFNNANNNNSSNNNNNSNNEYYNKEIKMLKDEIKNLNQKIEDSRKEIESTEITKYKLEIEKYQTENNVLKQQSNTLTNQINALNENVKNYEKKQEKLQKFADAQKDKLIKTLNNHLGNMSLEMNILKNDNMKLTQGNFQKNGGKYGKFVNPKLIDTESPLNNLTLEEEKNVYIFTSLCNKSTKGLYNILLDYDRDNDFHMLKQEFISVMDYLQLPFEQRDTILKVSGFDKNAKLSINQIVSAFYDREENKIIRLNQSLFNIIYKLAISKKTVEDVYKEMTKKCKNKLIKNDDLVQVLQQFLIREEDINGLISNWEYKKEDGEGFINMEDLTNHLKQRENIINDIVDINNEIKFGDPNFDNNNVKEYDDNRSKSEYSNNSNSNIKKKSIKNDNHNNHDNDVSDEYNYNFDKNDDEENNKKDIYNSNIKKSQSKNIYNESNNQKKQIENYNDIQESEKEKEKEKEIENENENEYNDYNDFDNKIEDVDNNNSIEKNIEDSKNEEMSYNNDNNTENNINENDNENDNINENVIENENENEDNNDSQEIDLSSKKKKKKSTSKKKKKGKKSKEKLNINDTINGELKIQVNNIENVMVPKTVSTPCSFSLTCSVEGIDKILKSREVVTDDLRNVTFNWATRVVLKKKTLKDLSSFCTINLLLEQDNKSVSLGNCQFPWTKCLLKSNWDKFAINEFFQVLTERKYKKIPMGNIKIMVKFIPFGSKSSNYEKNGKKKKTPTNLNGIVEEQSHNSSISRENKNGLKENKSIDNNINESNAKEEEVDNNNDNNNDDNGINQNKDNNKLNENNDVDEHQDSVYSKEINMEDDDEEEENNGNQIIKDFDVEITSVDNKKDLINKGYYLFVAAVEDGYEQEKINKNDGNLKDILQKLPYTCNFSVYSYKNNKKIKVYFYLKDEEDNEVGKLPIILSNKESHLELTGKFNFKTKNENEKSKFYLKITVNTT